MAKTFYTERDIEDLFAGGQTSLVLSDEVVITDLAREKAMRIGFKLLQEHDKPPSAPERPYLAKDLSPKKKIPPTNDITATTISSIPTPAPKIVGKTSAPRDLDKLEKKIFDAVMRKLDGNVDPHTLSTIIIRVMRSVGGD